MPKLSLDTSVLSLVMTLTVSWQMPILGCKWPKFSVTIL